MPKIAIVQAGTPLFDKPATLEKVKKNVEEAAGNGAELVLFPEAFIGGYPKWNSFGITMGTRTPEGRKEFKRWDDQTLKSHTTRVSFVLSQNCQLTKYVPFLFLHFFDVFTIGRGITFLL